MALPSDRLLRVEDVAEYLGVTPGALYVQRYRGQEPGSLAISVGRSLRWNPDTLNEWVNGQQQGSK